MKKRFLVCIMLDDGIPQTKIFELSEETEIEDCSAPEKTILMLIILTEEEIEKVYESFIGVNMGTPGTIIHLTENMEVEENKLYFIHPITGDIIPKEFLM